MIIPISLDLGQTFCYILKLATAKIGTRVSRREGKKMSRFDKLIEILIIIVVVAILALIIIPRVERAGRRANETILRGNLQQLRDGIQQFKKDCGDYPPNLEQLVYVVVSENEVGPTGKKPDKGYWRGPYIKTPDGKLPKDPFTDSRTTWKYTPRTGEVRSGSREQSPCPQKKGQDPHYNTW